MDNIFFQSWESLGRITIITVLAYISVIIILRITGKRTLSKMNAFDFIVTIALGSSFATVALNKDIPLADGALLFFLLIILQFIITWLSSRIKSFKNIITSKPALLIYKGEVLNAALRKERVTLEEIYVAARKKELDKLEDIDAAILETTGELTIIENLKSIDVETLEHVDKQYYKKEKPG
ncbi:MAG TPA: YetF domain-containing protein [Prolixibacteraceae bacterium]|nr:YetF domain-containing protein [Prolixibacteraceae bacterium]